MIEGYFDPAGRPYVRAYVVVPGRQPAPEATALPAGHRRRQHLHPARRGEDTGNKHTGPESDGHKQGNRRHDQLRHYASLHRIPREALALAKDKTRLLSDRTGGSGARPGQQKPAVSTGQGRDRPLPAAVRQDERQAPAHSAPGGRDNEPLTAAGLTPRTPTDQG